MASVRPVSALVPDRLSYLWLVLGGVLGLFAFGQWTVSLAPWLGAVCFVRFTRTQKTLRGYFILSLVRMGLAAFFLSQLVPTTLIPGRVRIIVIVVGSLSAILPYLADRLIAPRIEGFISTLVFPVACTAWEFFTLSINPMGTFGAVAYSQFGFLPLMQLVSVTGLSGLTFLITWFGSTSNWIWERSFSWPAIRSGVAIYTATLAAVLLYGGMRLAFHQSAPGTIRVASFSLRGEGSGLPSLAAKDRASFREKTGSIHARYCAETRRQADSGAQMVLWPEAAGICAGEDEAELIASGQKLAREKNIYLAMSLFTLKLDQPPENKLIVVDPKGKVVLEHYKYGGNQFEGSVLGDGVLQTFETPSATISGVICWDMDFPRIVGQSGRNGTDILLAPANDWEAVSTTHAYMAVFRSIENGVSMVRHAKNGLSITTDPYGRTLAKMDHFTASERMMIAQVPTTGVTTVYSVIGDLFAWLNVGAFPLLICHGVIVGRRKREQEPDHA